MFKSIMGWSLILCLIVVGIWYFSLKKYDYTIQFESPAPPGKLYHKLLNWNFKNIEKEEIKEKTPFQEVVQEAIVNETPVSLTWKFQTKNDSITLAEVKVKNQENSFSNRINILFRTSSSQNILKKDILQFKRAAKADLNFYNIKIIGEAMAPESTCACIPLKSKINKKAHKMIRNIGFLSDYILENNLKMAGKPRIQVTNWNITTNEMEYLFCFPLEPMNDYPKSKNIFIKKFPSKKAIKAVFHGNYRNTHQAWYKLMNYAQIHGIKIYKKPLEIFHNNPEIGGNSLRWKSEIFLPTRTSK